MPPDRDPCGQGGEVIGRGAYEAVTPSAISVWPVSKPASAIEPTTMQRVFIAQHPVAGGVYTAEVVQCG